MSENGAGTAVRLSDSEWTVMRAVWEAAEVGADREVTAREVHDRIGDSAEWAYTTVRTLLARLVGKRALGERKRGNQSFYSARITRGEARASALRSLVDRAFDGTFGSLVQHIVSTERLSRREREQLERLIDEADTGAPTPRSTRKGPRR